MNRSPDEYLEDLCFDAQQAGEKSIKAVMVVRSMRVLDIHDLGHLLFVLEKVGEIIPEEILASAPLTMYATTTRCPHLDEPVTEEEYREAVQVAEAVVRWAEERL